MFNRGNRRSSICLLLSIGLAGPPTGVASEDGDLSRLYRTREEQREAGLRRHLTPWLTFSGLAELEFAADRFSSVELRDYADEVDATIQIGLVATPWEFLEAELIAEYDTATDKVATEETTLSLEYDSWDLTLGKQYLPFGVYFSRFATGPLIELGETRAKAATLTYDYRDRVELSVSAYRGRTREKSTDDNSIDMAFAVNAWASERLSFGMSYVTDLGDADSRLLEEEDDRFTNRVSGLSGYVLWVGNEFEVTFEALGATRSFDELETDRNLPFAWNLEFVHFTNPYLDWALRIEGSDELEDAPWFQYGVAVNARVHRYASLTVELLHGRFRDRIATDEDDNPYAHVNHVGLQLSVVF